MLEPATAHGRAPREAAPMSVPPRIGTLAVGAMLRSRLHPVLDRRLMLLTVTGRRTGRAIAFDGHCAALDG